jgi:hypothetical protein
MSATEAADYIRNDLGKSIIDDVHPCLNLGRAEGGYFGVPRLVLAYVDYLGALYNGYDGSVDRTGRRVFAKTIYAKTFLVEVFGAVHKDYKKYGGLLYDIYRHGTVHLYEPLTLRNSSTGQTIEWHVFKQEKETRPPTRVGGTTKPWNLMLLHLIPTRKPGQTDPNVWVLPVSINCLYSDLLAALDVYAERLQKETDLANRFQKTINALLIPEETDLLWP